MKWTIPLVILLVAILALVALNIDGETIDESGKTMTFNVTSGSSNLSNFINTVKTSPYYNGYDTETVNWMESLGEKRVFFSNDSIVIISISEAGKIPPDPGITDVYVHDIFTAKVIESHRLCKMYPTVYLVDEVKFKNQEIIGNGLA